MNFRSFFLLLIICALLPEKAEAQRLYLKISASDERSELVLDSIGIKSVFDDRLSMDRELDSLAGVLNRMGFIENRIGSVLKINDSTYSARVDLNRRFDTIYIYYLNTGLNRDDFEPYFEDVTDEYILSKIQNIETRLNGLNRKLANRGQPFLELQLIDIRKRDDKNLQADLVIRKKRSRRIDKLVIRGYEKFPKSFLKHLLRIRTGSTYDLDAIRRKSEELNNLRFANQQRPPETLFTADSTTLYFYLEKTKSNSFDGFLGFGNNEQTNKLEFDGYLNLNLINSLNFGETLQLNYKSDENDQQTLNIRSQLPYLFGSPLGIDLNLNIFKKDTTFTTVSQSADLFYALSPNQNISAGISAIQSNDLLNSGREDIEDLRSTFVNLKYQKFTTNRSSLLFPIPFSLEAGIGLGSRRNDSSDVNQQRYQLNVSKILSLNERNSIFLRLQSSGLISDDYFDNELLRFGGINNIRGFEENTLVASLFGVLNTEYRYQLSSTIYVHTIIDAAYFENDLIKSNGKLFGYGFGFGLITRAGLFRFNYANGKFDNQNFKLANSKIHISLNATF